MSILYIFFKTGHLSNIASTRRREASPTTSNLLDSIQKKTIRLINDPILSAKLLSLGHRHAVGDLYLLYRYFHRLLSNEAAIVPPLVTFLWKTKISNNSNVPLSTSKSTEHPCSLLFFFCIQGL